MAGFGGKESTSFLFTPTWVVAGVCFIIVFISLVVERSLHRLGKCLKRKHQDSLYEALEKLKEELMLLGFISLLLTVFQSVISQVCVPHGVASIMLPCKRETISSQTSHISSSNGRRLLAGDSSPTHCARERVPLLSLEALHQLHIFIFVLAVVHVIFCVTTVLLGGTKIRQWNHWEKSIKETQSAQVVHHQIFSERAGTYWRKFTVVSIIAAFFKQFYGSVTKSDYVALRAGFIRAHCPRVHDFDFHKYMLRTLEHDFKKIVGISWYLWLFVIFFLLMNIAGWHMYFWLSFLPLVLLLLVGAKLEYIITKLAKDVAESRGDPTASAKPSDELFWFHNPTLVLYLIHFILFQNSFEMAFFFWVGSTYGFKSCIMEGLAFIIPRLFVGVTVQVLCSYSTLPLYALVTQMGSRFKQGMFNAYTEELIIGWARPDRRGGSLHGTDSSHMVKTSLDSICIAEEPTVDHGITASSVIELTHQNRPRSSFS